MTHYRLVACVATLMLLPGCGDSAPLLSIGNVQIVAPAPGRSASVAYLTIRNDGAATRLLSISSPEFATVELHETAIEDGIARMQRVPVLEIGAHSATDLKPGGLHIMLLDPATAPLPGNPVTLRLEFESGDMLVVEAPLANRVSVE